MPEQTGNLTLREREIGRRKELTIETGKMAKQADGSVVIRYGDTMVLVAATRLRRSRARASTSSRSPSSTSRRRTAAGKIPGGYFKREGRPTEKEILTSPPHRSPAAARCSPKGWRDETQVIAHRPLDRQGEPVRRPRDHRRVGARCTISDIPWAGPIAGVRVGRIDGEFIVNPTFAADAENCDLDLVVAASRDAIVMVEGGADGDLRDDDDRRAPVRAPAQCQPIIDLQEKIRAAAGKAEARVRRRREGRRARRAGQGASPTTASKAAMAIARQAGALRHAAKVPRRSSSPRSAPASRRAGTPREKEVDAAFEDLQEEARARHRCSTSGMRIDGRRTHDDPPDHLRGRRCSRAPTARRSSPAARPRRWSRRRSAPPRTCSASTRSPATSPSASCCTTTSRRSRRARAKPMRGPAAARSATATWPSARSPRCCPPYDGLPLHDPHRLGDHSSRTARRRWPRSAAAACRSWTRACPSPRRWPASPWA